MRKLTIITICCFSIALAAPFTGSAKDKKDKKHKEHKNTISLYDVYNTGKYKFKGHTNNLKHIDRHNNFGLAYQRELLNLHHDLHLSAGLRLLTAQSEVTVGTQLAGFDQYGSKFTFIPKYKELSVPVYLTRTIPLKRYPKATLIVFAGGSVGISKITEYKVGRLWYNESGNHDQLGTMYEDFKTNVSHIGMNATLDAGFRISPFGTPKLSLGCAVSYNLLQSVNYNDQGAFGNATQNKYDYFNVDFSRRFINVLFSVNYSFGK